MKKHAIIAIFSLVSIIASFSVSSQAYAVTCTQVAEHLESDLRNKAACIGMGCCFFGSALSFPVATLVSGVGAVGVVLGADRSEVLVSLYKHETKYLLKAAHALHPDADQINILNNFTNSYNQRTSARVPQEYLIQWLLQEDQAGRLCTDSELFSIDRILNQAQSRAARRAADAVQQAQAQSQADARGQARAQADVAGREVVQARAALQNHLDIKGQTQAAAELEKREATRIREDKQAEADRRSQQLAAAELASRGQASATGAADQMAAPVGEPQPNLAAPTQLNTIGLRPSRRLKILLDAGAVRPIPRYASPDTPVTLDGGPGGPGWPRPVVYSSSGDEKGFDAANVLKKEE